MSIPTFVISTSADSQLYFTLRAANNEVILTSETYTSASSVRTGTESVRTHAPYATNSVKHTSRTGEPYFVLRAVNHEVVGTSEMYSSAQARDTGIEAVQRAAPSAEVVHTRG